MARFREGSGEGPGEQFRAYGGAWAADPARHAQPPRTFEAILGWLLDGLDSLLVDPAHES